MSNDNESIMIRTSKHNNVVFEHNVPKARCCAV